MEEKTQEYRPKNWCAHIDKVRPRCTNPSCKRQGMLFYRLAKLWKCIKCGMQNEVTEEQTKFIGERGA